MNPVLVRFAGKLDAVVRRKAIADGQKLKPGLSSKSIFRGYLITVTAGPAQTIATVVDLGVLCFAGWGVSMIIEQDNSYQEVWRLPQRLRLELGGGRLPESQYGGGAGDNTGLPQWKAWLNRAYYRSKARSLLMNRSTLPAAMDGQAAGGYAVAAKMELSRYGVTHAWLGGAFVSSGVPGQNPLTGPYLARYPMIGASLQMTHWSSAGSWMIQLQDDWVSNEAGANLCFVGGPWRTDIDSRVPAHEWIRIGATRSPQLIDDANEGGIGSGYFPHAVTRESPLAYRQNCHPGIVIGDNGVLVAAPMARLDDDLFELYGQWEPAGSLKSGYVSSRSLANGALYEVGASLVSAAFHPEIVLMRFSDSPVTRAERESWWRFSMNESADTRYVMRVQGSRAGATLVAPAPGQDPVPNPDNYPREASDAKQWAGAVRIGLSELPQWLRPGTVAQRSAYLRDALGDWVFGAEADTYIPLIESEQPLPAAFGAMYSTCIDGEAEFVCSVKSLDSALVDVGASRRLSNDQPTAPSQALLAVAKTGLVFVRANTDDASGYSISTAFHDVIGPADCAQFGAGMSAGVAYLPQVRFACVLDSKRVYAVRAVRYERNAFLASALTMTGVNVPIGYTPNYEGRRNSSVGGPVFYTEREFGPYPDRTQYEELWFVVDGVKHVINTRALGGNIEPITEGKFGNGLQDVFKWFASSVNAQRRQMLGMFSAADESDYELLDFYADEFVCPGSEMNTFAQVSDSDVMFVLHQRTGPSAGRRYNAVVCRFSAETGAASVVTTVNDPGQQAVGRYAALTCYQHELRNEDGIVVQPACLLLRMGSSDIGQVLSSVDGGETWELLYDHKSTRKINVAGNAYSPNGTPSLGLHVIGGVGVESDPQKIIRGGV